MDNSIYVKRQDIKMVGNMYFATIPTHVNDELAIDLANDNDVFIEDTVNVSYVNGSFILSSNAPRDVFEGYVNEVDSELVYMEAWTH